MIEPSKKNFVTPFAVLAMSVSVVLLAFIWQGHKGFSLWDEGFLWYGAQRVMLGEVPIRDFMSYDPGRYYWSAALMSLWGDHGIMSLRMAVAVFQALGLFAGLLVLAKSVERKGTSDYLFWLIAAASLLVWMYPRHKLFDICLSMLLVAALTVLISRPVSRSYLFAGVCIGLAATFGRNHGLYGLIGGLSALTWLSFKRTSEPSFIQGGLTMGFGVVAGFSPVLLMALFIPGFAVPFWESVRFLFEQKATNLPVPVPWPWTVEFADVRTGALVRALLIGVFFVVVPLTGVLAIFWAFVRRARGQPVPPPLVASVFLILPYSHYAFSRADIGHLAQGVFPFLLAFLLLVIRSGWWLKWCGSIVFLVINVWIMLPYHPGWQCRGNGCVELNVAVDRLKIDPETALNVAYLESTVGAAVAEGKNFLVVPFWPGAYPVFHAKAPVWEIYSLFPRPPAFEQREIARIKSASPNVVLVLDIALDGRDDLRYRNTHPLTHEYIVKNFEPVPGQPASSYQLYRSKSAAP